MMMTIHCWRRLRIPFLGIWEEKESTWDGSGEGGKTWGSEADFVYALGSFRVSFSFLIVW
jgi:hypothetical protein